jgi:5-(carboxyamino)imidazole ribonucleotide mutase
MPSLFIKVPVKRDLCTLAFYYKYKSMKPIVGIIMGSQSDLTVMQAAADVLTAFGVPHECTIVSAHRTPDRMRSYALEARDRGLKVIIAGAGGAAHLPGMVASYTTLPVIGVPVKSSNSIDGWDSVLSILQMPSGVPVATVALNGAKNAGLLAIQIIGVSDDSISEKLIAYKKTLEDQVMQMVENLKK